MLNSTYSVLTGYYKRLRTYLITNNDKSLWITKIIVTIASHFWTPVSINEILSINWITINQLMLNAGAINWITINQFNQTVLSLMLKHRYWPSPIPDFRSQSAPQAVKSQRGNKAQLRRAAKSSQKTARVQQMGRWWFMYCFNLNSWMMACGGYCWFKMMKSGR